MMKDRIEEPVTLVVVPALLTGNSSVPAALPPGRPEIFVSAMQLLQAQLVAGLKEDEVPVLLEPELFRRNIGDETVSLWTQI
jgi:hypothetical protein